jgi:hypothetical protein
MFTYRSFSRYIFINKQKIHYRHVIYIRIIRKEEENKRNLSWLKQKLKLENDIKHGPYDKLVLLANKGLQPLWIY